MQKMGKEIFQPQQMRFLTLESSLFLVVLMAEFTAFETLLLSTPLTNSVVPDNWYRHFFPLSVSDIKALKDYLLKSFKIISLFKNISVMISARQQLSAQYYLTQFLTEKFCCFLFAQGFTAPQDYFTDFSQANPVDDKSKHKITHNKKTSLFASNVVHIEHEPTRGEGSRDEEATLLNNWKQVPSTSREFRLWVHGHASL